MKKKSLVGWTSRGWKQYFDFKYNNTTSHIKEIDTPPIYERQCYNSVNTKVRLTIQEIK